MQKTDAGTKTSRGGEFFSGLRAGAPILLGFIPIGFAFAIAARQAGLLSSEAVWMSALVFAGASQIAAASMLTQGAGLAAILLATCIINLRHIIMSTCVMHRLRPTGLFLRLLAAFGVTDETFIVFTTAGEEDTGIQYLLGVECIAYLGWVAGTALGCVTTAFLPELVAKSLDITLYAMFIGLIAPDLRDNPALVWTVVCTAGLSWVARLFLDNSWAMILATLLGAGVGVVLNERRARA